jgi:hypothetical protein
MLIYFLAIWNILRTFAIFMTIWYVLFSFGTIFSCFGIMYQEKSGNTATVYVPKKRIVYTKAISDRATFLFGIFARICSDVVHSKSPPNASARKQISEIVRVSTVHLS